MKYILFENGDKMPAFGLGTWKSERDQVKKSVKDAVRAGYRHIDCAAIYGNEDVVGEAFAELFAEGVVKREDLWITSKLWNDSHQAQYVFPALERTLKDLQIDYLDLYLIHWPVALRHGVSFPEKAEDFLSAEEAPIGATWAEMEKLKMSGKVRHIGVSNFSVSKLKALLPQTNIKPEMNQIEIHPHFKQKELVDFCLGNGINVTAYSPLGCAYRPKAMQAPVLDDAVITQIASDREVTPAQVVLAWGMQRGYAVIPKSVNPERIRNNFASVEFQLTDDEMDSINKIPTDLRLTDGALWCIDGSPWSLTTLWE